MSFLKQTESRIVILSVIAVIVILDLFVVLPSYNDFVSNILKVGTTIAGFTVLLGAINVTLIHGRRISKRTPGQWYFSIWTIFIVVLTFFLGVGSLSNDAIANFYSLYLSKFFQPMSAAAYALISFYVVSLIFRSFRARNIEIALFLIAAIAVELLNAPIGGVINPILPKIGTWFREVLSIGGQRGIVIGSAVGIIAAGLRSLLGQTREAIGG